VLVVAAICGAAFEVAKRGNEESRLPHEPLGPAVVRRAWLEHAKRPPLEVVDAVLTPLELVVQTKDFSDEARPQMKRRLGSLLVRDSTCDSEKDLSLSGAENGS
jgi:hypothetical protein